MSPITPDNTPGNPVRVGQPTIEALLARPDMGATPEAVRQAIIDGENQRAERDRSLSEGYGMRSSGPKSKP